MDNVANINYTLLKLNERLDEFIKGVAFTKTGDYSIQLAEISASLLFAHPSNAKLQLEATLVILEHLLEKPVETYNIHTNWSGYFEVPHDETTYIEIPTPLTLEERRQCWPVLLEELNIYKKYLQILLTESKANEGIHQKNVNCATEIQLPENFNLEDIMIHFEPKLSAKQVSLFLHFLKESRIIPNYSNTALSRFSPALFGRSDNTVRGEIGKIHFMMKQSDYSELKALKNHLMGLIDLINKEIDI